ncbi:MAG: hypothetical protein KF788_12365 [Piscinibacter sp.]|nr:hypothetical protein [Piscinibacter sp.]
MAAVETTPAELTAATWERQAGALAKARPATVGDALRALQKAHEAVPWALLQIEGLNDPGAAELRVAQLRSEGERRLRPLCQQAQAAGQAATRWLSGARKESASARPALQAAEAIVRAGPAWAGTLERAWRAALEGAEKRFAELQAAAQQARAGRPEDSPERRRVRARVIDQFRIVKNRPDRKVLFLLCLGHKSCAPYLGPTVSDAQKPLLTKVLKGDTGFKFFRGECIWEEGGYTFVGSRLSMAHARRIERGLLELTGTRWRVRARE